MTALGGRFLIAFFAVLPLGEQVLRGADATDQTRIDLVVDEPRENRRVAWPVTTGVPFPEGKLTRAEQCRLVDDKGEEQPLQAKVAATWDAEKASIRWLTIDFIAQPGRRYALEFGPGVRRKSFSKTLDVRDGESLVVDTGRLRLEFARKGPAALRSVSIDLNGDGRIDAGEQIAGGGPDGDHFFIDQKGDVSSSARDGDERTIAVESDGPVRCCVRVDGWYTSPAGARIVRYRTRYHLFAGLPVMKLVDEFRVVGSTRDVQFRDAALPLAIKLDPATRRVTTGWDDGAASVAVPWQAATRSVSLAQETYRHYGNLECKAAVAETTADGERRVREGERAGAWLQASDERAGVTGSLQAFWQQFPKEWELTGDRLTLHLWSPRGGALDFGEKGLREFFGPAGHKYLLNWDGVRGVLGPIENFFYFAGRHALARDGADGLGINKHHEAWFHFASAAEAEAGREYAALADRPPLCLATGAWNVSTGVFGPLAARPNDSPYEAIVDRIFGLERYAQDAFGDYGWWLFGAGPHYSYQWDKSTGRHYADPRRFEYHTYQRETQLWWCYLRSGQRKFYDWAVPNENHWVDVAVSHVPTKFSTEWRGAKGDATLHFPAGDWSIDSPLHYVRHHDTGEAWLRSASQFWASYHRTLETTTLAYYLTGDERYNDVVNLWRDYWSPLAGVKSDLADVKAWHREQLWFQPTAAGQPAKTWAEMVRDYSPFQSGSRHQMTLFFNLSTLYEHTWDPAIARVLHEYADAFLDPDSPNGVWQCQDHRLPANADSPLLSHYWSPALWKYARATKDLRMPGVLKKYFTAVYEADPYGEDVGIYSNVQIAWAWHFTHDPRHLIAAKHELEDLSAAAPLAKPEDLGMRIYNPYDPIRTLATVPRLIGALAEADRGGIAVPDAPALTPQRALIVLDRRRDEPLHAVTWGWDKTFATFDGEGPFRPTVETLAHCSHRQPFDRTLPEHRVYRTTLDAPVSKQEWCFLFPELELGVLELKGVDAVWCWEAEPLHLEPRRFFWWRRGESTELTIESAMPSQLRLVHDAKELAGKTTASTLVASVADVKPGEWITIEPRTQAPVWFHLSGVPDSERWVSTSRAASDVPPSAYAALRGRPNGPRGDVPARKVRSGAAPGPWPRAAYPRRSRRRRRREAPTLRREAGDDRVLDPPAARRPRDPVAPLGPRRERPAPRPEPREAPARRMGPHRHRLEARKGFLDGRRLVHVYVDGRDDATYRNLYWDGYNGPPQTDPRRPWLHEFVFRCPPGVAFAIDDVRISRVPRYVNLNLEFNSRQTWNANAFTPTFEPAAVDDSTLIRLPLDGKLEGTASGKPFEAKLTPEKR